MPLRRPPSRVCRRLRPLGDHAAGLYAPLTKGSAAVSVEAREPTHNRLPFMFPRPHPCRVGHGTRTRSRRPSNDAYSIVGRAAPMRRCEAGNLESRRRHPGATPRREPVGRGKAPRFGNPKRSASWTDRMGREPSVRPLALPAATAGKCRQHRVFSTYAPLEVPCLSSASAGNVGNHRPLCLAPSHEGHSPVGGFGQSSDKRLHAHRNP